MIEGRTTLPVWIFSVFFIVTSLASFGSPQNESLSDKCDELEGVRSDRINCTSKEEPSCFRGWTGELCNTAICREGCHPIHGYCTQPGECKCALGWRGKKCDECVPLPGCKHGYCSTTSYECICEPGWDGKYCSIPVCLEGCHSTRGYCKFPNECRCRIGWGGHTCEECKPLPGCVNGYCTKPLECRCHEGWTGLHCDIPTCKENCSTKHGYCLQPGECRCKVGWWGEHCDTCFPYPGCKHGTCNEPWECICKEGWKGMYCDQRNATGEGFCDKNPGRCLNGGTCINVPDERNYTCSCPSLFTGKHCDYLAYSRASIFPIFSRGSSEYRSTFSTTRAPVLKPTSKQNYIPTKPPNLHIYRSTTEGNSDIPQSRDNHPSDSNHGESFISELISDPMSMSASAPSASSSTHSPLQPIINASLVDTEGFTNPNDTLNPSIPFTTESPKEVYDNRVPFSDNFTTYERSGETDLTEKRKKYFEKKNQLKLSPKQQNGNEDENIFPSTPFSGKLSDFFPEREINNPKLKELQTLDPNEATTEYEEKPEENILENTDANSPKANQIRGRTRFLRHHTSLNEEPTDEITDQQSSLISLGNIQVTSEDRKSASRNPYLLPRDEIPLSSRKPFFDRQLGLSNRNLSHLIPQTRINRRTGIPPPSSDKSSPNDGINSNESSNRTNRETNKETSSIDEDPENKVLEKPKTYYEENYAGRVHIGDVTEVDRHAPLEEIVDAFIELKKLTS